LDLHGLGSDHGDWQEASDLAADTIPTPGFAFLDAHALLAHAAPTEATGSTGSSTNCSLKPQEATASPATSCCHLHEAFAPSPTVTTGKRYGTCNR
jgi:hypothetical protein